jgi:hypothetical protein
MRVTATVGLALALVLMAAGCGDDGESGAAVAGTDKSARPLQTGQVVCADVEISADVCAGSGQDGETRAGVPRRYRDNGDGTISDLSSGLSWEKKSDDGSVHDRNTIYLWRDVFPQFIAVLNRQRFAGHDDWRLPNVNELQTLVDYGNREPAIDAVFNQNCSGGCTVTNCSCTASNAYWSSTFIHERSARVWSVYFDEGGVAYGLKNSNGYYVRAVRGGL